jgi:hypothetical protein
LGYGGVKCLHLNSVEIQNWLWNTLTCDFRE